MAWSTSNPREPMSTSRPSDASRATSPERVSPTDADLVARVKMGEFDAFSGLMRRYNRRVFRAARSFLRDDMSAEDTAQNAWLSAYEKLGQFDPSRGAFGTWVATIAVHDAIGHLRKAATRGRTLDAQANEVQTEADAETADLQSPEKVAFRNQARAYLEAAVDALPEDLRAVLVLRDVEELSGADAAHILGVSEIAVRVRLLRARRALRAAMESALEEDVADLFGFDGARCDRIVERVARAITHSARAGT